MSTSEWISIIFGAAVFLVGQAWLVGRVISGRFEKIESASTAADAALRSDMAEHRRRHEASMHALRNEQARLDREMAVLKASLPTIERIEAMLDKRFRPMERHIDRLADALTGRSRRLEQDDGA